MTDTSDPTVRPGTVTVTLIDGREMDAADWAKSVDAFAEAIRLLIIAHGGSHATAHKVLGAWYEGLGR